MNEGFKPGPIGWSKDNPPKGPASIGVGLIIISKNPPLMGLDFGDMKVRRIQVNPKRAMNNINLMRQAVVQAFGELDYTTEGLTLKVSVDRHAKTIDTEFPKRLNMLVANPEVFLAWAQRLEEALAEIGSQA